MSRHYVDAFTGEGCRGNRACVVELSKWLPDEEMLAMAAENALPETAFFIRKGQRFSLRWFTPDIEMDLCGHATLATAFVISQVLNYEKQCVVCDTCSGEVSIDVSKDGMLTLDFPSRSPIPANLPQNIFDSLCAKPKAVFKARDYVLEYDDPSIIAGFTLDRELFDQVNIDPGGVVITAPGTDCDFVSRFFTPQATILEDPVTGSAHCSLVPFWSERLGKKKLVARQLSEQGGTLYCEDCGERVKISGYAKLV